VNGQPQRLNVSYQFVWDGDWHVGSGFGSATVDRTVRRRAAPKGKRGEPYVPGSQIKGVLRHHCERLVATFDGHIVSPHALGGFPVDLVTNFRPLARSGLLIDRLFGTRYEGSCFFVEDAVAAPDADWPARPHSRTSIDRVSGTARDQTLFVTEVVAGRGRALRGHIQARHPKGALTRDGDGFPFEYALLLAGLLTLDSLGGDKSTGLGRCRVAIDETGLKWNGAPLLLVEALTSFDEADWLLLVEMVREANR
jgi:CRISPR/Cas system CSM-associated protein Csm3 (group 7 of RAMP superfamily)